ncbi:hypothetical protein [Natronorarus salvus]|uniref:hypothetical protein n=1 Tax=Natronorarus salvus TaxID=3117733 RepID=UPI002F26D429
MGWFSETAQGAVKRCLGRVSPYGTLTLTEDAIADLRQRTPPRHAVSIQPNKDGGGIENGIDLLTAVHSARSRGLPMLSKSDAPTHAYEMRNINGKIGFQYVMGRKKDQRQLERQLETFYPDAHIQVSEHPHPGLLPLQEGRHVAVATLRLRQRENGKHLYPIKHVDVEGFENDPYGSITAEMIGERETDVQTDVAVQVIFRPASAKWWKGGLLSAGIDDIADELKQPHKEFTMVDALKYEARPEQSSLEGEEREPSDQDLRASKIVRRQRGEKGFRLNVRILAVSDDPEEAIARVDETAEMFEGYYESTTEQGFEPVPRKGKDMKAVLRQAFAREWADEKIVMGVRSAAGLMHIPNETINTQNVEWSLTSHAGDVPADAARFSDYQTESFEWKKEDRSHQLADERWQYDVAAIYDESEQGPPEEPEQNDLEDSGRTDSEDEPSEATA